MASWDLRREEGPIFVVCRPAPVKGAAKRAKEFVAVCGIAGIVGLSPDPARRRIVESMVEVMRHRGPDGEGLISTEHAALGHVRLSIIDVEGSKQPLANEDESVWVTFNGEIYNYRELREHLLGRGHRLKTSGDTETLVHLYEEYGPEMVHRLQGMFAFAIWDTKRRQLFLARDRMGIKPLYYSQCGGDFVFASEPKAFFQHPGIDAAGHGGDLALSDFFVPFRLRPPSSKGIVSRSTRASRNRHRGGFG